MHGVPAHMLGELVKPTVATAGRGERASTVDVPPPPPTAPATHSTSRSDDDIAQCMERLMEVLDHILPIVLDMSCDGSNFWRSPELMNRWPSGENAMR